MAFVGITTSSVTAPMVGGLALAYLAPGTQIDDDDKQKFTLPEPVHFTLNPISNSQMDAYAKDMGSKTHGLVGQEANGTLHLLARGQAADFSKGSLLDHDVIRNLSQNLSPLAGALVAIFSMRVVPPADQVSALSALLVSSDKPALIDDYETLGYLQWMSDQTGYDWSLPDARIKKHIAATRPDFTNDGFYAVVKPRNPLLNFVTSVQNEGDYPTTTLPAFSDFIHRVPHLFQNGLAILKWIDQLEAAKHQMRSGLKLLKTIVNTAAITAPTDLWIARQVFATYQKLGVLDELKTGAVIHPKNYAASKNWNARQMEIDFHFLYTRGYLDKTDEGYRWSNNDSAWVASPQDLELGYQLVPLILDLHTKGFGKNIKAGTPVAIPDITTTTMDLLHRTGLVDAQNNWTIVAPRILDKATGPFGIIYTYQDYLLQHEALLTSQDQRPHVARAKNIAHSEHAHRESFKGMVQSYADYLKTNPGKPKIVIEHAVAKGVALQEFIKFFKNNGWDHVEEDVQFCGFDYEETALDTGARQMRAQGVLPANTILEQADIGAPDQMLAALLKAGVKKEDLKGAVLFVGAGFHEIRKSDDEIIEVIRKYHDLGIIIVSDETSDLTANQLRDTAFQTYHAGFQWVHETSGQILRPAWRYDKPMNRLSWQEVFTQGGYTFLADYSKGTRPIAPISAPPQQSNPPHRMAYFFIP